MKKTIILTTMLTLIAMTGWAQKQVAWEKPTAFMGAYNSEFEITKVELKQTETVLHVLANYSPGSWIRFAKESFVQTPDGTKYAFTGGAKTNEQESDLMPDSLFWMPESGKANLALHFKPVPLDTKEMDFLEGDFDGAFRFWNISDSKTKKDVVLPDDWKNVQYAKDETLPVAKINKGIATIKVKMLGYKKGMDLDIQFVYITSPSSPLKTWQTMIKDIDGDHYYLTKEQYNYILEKYESQGIPTYAIYDTEGQQTFKTIGFSGLDTFKNEVEKVLK